MFDASATDTTNSNFFNGREFTVIRAAQDSGNKYFVECSTSGMNFPDADFNIAATNNDGKIYSELSTSVEAFFQGANNVFKGADVNFSNKKVVLREIGTANKHSYTNKMVDGLVGSEMCIRDRFSSIEKIRICCVSRGCVKQT